jgi:hypothetical protein
MPQGYDGLPSYYTGSSNPITPNLGLGLKGMDPVIAEDFVLIDTAFGGINTAIKVNGSVVNSPNFKDSATVIFTVVGSDITITASTLVGDSGGGGIQGCAPAPAAGDFAAGKYLDAGGGWSVPLALINGGTF